MSRKNQSKYQANNYYWQGYDANAKQVSGHISADSLTEAKEYLTEKKVYLKFIKLKKKSYLDSLFQFKLLHFTKKDRSIELYYFTKQLDSLLIAGLNLEKAILSMQKTTKNSDIKKMLTTIHLDLTRGFSFNDSLEKHSNFFPKIYLSVINVASKSRKFNQSLGDLAKYLKKKNELNQGIKKALLYPKIILIISLMLSTVLLLTVVPVFEQIYQNSSSFNNIPFITSIILKISNTLNHYFAVIVSSLFVFFLLVKFIFSLRRIKELVDLFLIKLPIVGDLTIKSNVAYIFRMVSTLDKSNMNLVNSLRLVAENTKNVVYKDSLFEISQLIASGISISEAFSRYSIFPEYAIQMIHTGENTNQFSIMLSSIAQMYESQINDSLEKMKTLIEPVSMLFLSLIVATIVVGMYLPIFSMGSTL